MLEGETPALTACDINGRWWDHQLVVATVQQMPAWPWLAISCPWEEQVVSL